GLLSIYDTGEDKRVVLGRLPSDLQPKQRIERLIESVGEGELQVAQISGIRRRQAYFHRRNLVPAASHGPCPGDREHGIVPSQWFGGRKLPMIDAVDLSGEFRRLHVQTPCCQGDGVRDRLRERHLLD